MAATNTSVLAYGNLFQIGAGDVVSGVNQVSTIAFGGAPSAGSVTLRFWNRTFTFSTAAGLPTAVSFAATLNAIFGTAYATPFAVSLTSNTYTVTAQGPFAAMPLPAFQTVANTSLQTITHVITVPGVVIETYATVAGVQTMPSPKPTKATEDYTTFDLGNGGYMSSIAKLKSVGEMNLTLVYLNDATQDNISGLNSLFEAATAYDFRLIVPTKQANPTLVAYGYTAYFVAFLTSYQDMGEQADARMTTNITLKVDGKISRFPPLV